MNCVLLSVHSRSQLSGHQSGRSVFLKALARSIHAVHVYVGEDGRLKSGISHRPKRITSS